MRKHFHRAAVALAVFTVASSALASTGLALPPAHAASDVAPTAKAELQVEGATLQVASPLLVGGQGRDMREPGFEELVSLAAKNPKWTISSIARDHTAVRLLLTSEGGVWLEAPIAGELADVLELKPGAAVALQHRQGAAKAELVLLVSGATPLLVVANDNVRPAR